MKNLSLYLHIPFCEKKCNYCSFVSFCKPKNEIENYVNALCEEIKLSLTKEHSLLTIYLGGGTPSLLNQNQIQKIFETIKNSANISPNAEITIEVNPNSVTREKLLAYKQNGINRISVGIQSLNNKSLQTLGRLHNAKQAKNALKLIKSCGFENISVDLMLGIPHSTKTNIKHALKHFAKTATHISAYSLILEENTMLFNLFNAGKIKLPSEEKTVKQYEFVEKFLAKKGFLKYEVSNFAKCGFESKHNNAYWSLDDYLGLGVSAHSFVDNVRFSNPNSLEDYFEMMQNQNFEMRASEKISNSKLKEEFIMLSLRLIKGIDLIKYAKIFNEKLEEKKQKEIDLLINLDLLKMQNSKLFATKKGFNVLNQIILKLI